jgi:hypothetical protein
MNAKQIQWPGVGTKEKLAAAQLAIAAKLGPSKETPSKGGEPAFNILGKKKVEIAKLIMENINKPDLVDKKVREFGGLLNDKMMKDMFEMTEKIEKLTELIEKQQEHLHEDVEEIIDLERSKNNRNKDI